MFVIIWKNVVKIFLIFYLFIRGTVFTMTILFHFLYNCNDIFLCHLLPLCNNIVTVNKFFFSDIVKTLMREDSPPIKVVYRNAASFYLILIFYFSFFSFS